MIPPLKQSPKRPKKSKADNTGFVVPNVSREPEYQNPKSDLSDCHSDHYSGSRDSATWGTSGNQKTEARNQHFEAEDDAEVFEADA
jgi:hypothetical protein